MKCNWCGKGSGRGYTRDASGLAFYYYCFKCIREINKELNNGGKKI